MAGIHAESVPGVDDRAPLGFRVWAGRMRAMGSAHRHHDVEMNLPLDEPITYLIRGRPVTIPVGVLGLWWAAVPHQSEPTRADGRVVWVTLPLRWLWRWGWPTRLANALLDGRVIAGAQPVALDAPRMLDWAERFAPGGAEAARIIQLEVEARVRQLVVEGAAALDAEPSPGRSEARDANATATPPGVLRMAEVISERFREPLTVEQVADAAGLHPGHAMRRFRAHLGMTVVDYLTRQRVAEAQRLLITTGLPVQSVGLRSGFGSSSRFYAAFRQIAGTTPKRYRQQMGYGA